MIFGKSAAESIPSRSSPTHAVEVRAESHMIDPRDLRDVIDVVDQIDFIGGRGIFASHSRSIRSTCHIVDRLAFRLQFVHVFLNRSSLILCLSRDRRSESPHRQIR